MSRLDGRAFLQLGGAAIVAGGFLCVGGAEALAAYRLAALTEAEARALLAMTRTLFPHDDFPDAYYAEIVSGMDGRAAEEDDFRALLRDGVAALAAYRGLPFETLAPMWRVEAVRSVEGTPFFVEVRTATVFGLYNNNELVWAKLGYEGPSWQHGGYLYRGFDDLNWIPEPPAEIGQLVRG